MKTLMSRCLHFLMGIGLVFLLANVAAAQASVGPTVAGLVSTVQTSVLIPVLDVIIAISYLAGVGFTVAGIFKLKAHKDNPTQVTIGTPIFMLGVGIALLFAPALITAAAKSIFNNAGGGSLTYSSSSVTG